MEVLAGMGGNMLRDLEILEVLAESTELSNCWKDNYVGSEEEYFLLLAYGVVGVEEC